jgi:hypothetical protein
LNCPKCGKEVNDNEIAYCPYCGTPLKIAVPNQIKAKATQPSYYRPWQPLGYMSAAVGVVLFVAGLFAGSFSQSEYIGYYPLGYARVTYPYTQYSFPLIVIGIAVFVVGIAALTQKRSS